MRWTRPLERRGLPTVVVALGLVSLLTDLSSEMIYPLLPVFLSQVLGAGAVALGLIEGTAEATAALFKIVSGALTDRSGRRRPLVLVGYTLSSLARPLIGLARAWPFVLFCRFSDRVGKGLRTAPRDALIADWTASERRGIAYGLHRAMDHLGAVLGPLVAAALLAVGFGYRGVFLSAVGPAALAVLVVLFVVRERGRAARPNAPVEPAPSPRASRRWPPLLAGVFLAALGTPADVFLLLLLSRAGAAPWLIAVLWSVHSLFRFGASLGGGRLADVSPRLNLVFVAWTARAAILAALGFPHRPAVLIALFLIYGLAAGFSDPIERALVADLVHRQFRGRAFGLYHAAVGLGALPAGVLFGVVWDQIGAPVAFGLAAALILVAAALVRFAGGPASS
jgi:MFS family permease